MTALELRLLPKAIGLVVSEEPDNPRVWYEGLLENPEQLLQDYDENSWGYLEYLTLRNVHDTICAELITLVEVYTTGYNEGYNEGHKKGSENGYEEGRSNGE